MAEHEVERIIKKLDVLENKVSELSEKLAVHCASSESEKKAGGWKTYLIFMVTGGILSQGPAGISLLAKWLGIG